ncbi:MAG: TonB-dependent receptor [Bacteroidota bacterium]
MKRNSLLSLVLVFMLFTSAYGQGTVSGTVLNEEGDALEGATVIVQGTTVGALTNAQGKYVVNLPENSKVLVFTYVGYETQEITIDGRSTIDLTMVESLQIDEVIITGYGTQIKRDLTGNIAKVSGAEIENIPVTSFESALQGRAAGVLVSQQNGKLGQGINMRIRGSASVTASNEPLYVIDGVVITSASQSSLNAPTNPLADINFNDIESIEILKDASAAAIYGSRASNGVVILTTKKGKAGKTRFNVDYKQGFSEPTNNREWLSGPEYLDLWQEAFDNSDFNDGNGLVFGLTADEWRDRRIPGWRDGNDTDWEQEAFQEDAGFQEINLSASGGSDKSSFFISTSYLDQAGILIYNNFDRFSGRLNLDHKASRNVKIGMNMNFARTRNDRLPNDNSFSTPLQLIALPSAQPLLDPETGEFFERTVYFNGKLYEDNTSFQARVFRTIGNFYADWQIVPGLSLRSEFGVDFLSQNEEQYFSAAVARNTGEPNGLGRNNFTHTLNFTFNNFATYNTSFGESDLNVVGGMSFQESNTEFARVEGRNFPNDEFQKLASAAEIFGGTSTGTIFNIVSYFARANYKFGDKYLLSLAGRVDGDSRFGNDERYGFFPAASLGWIISEENFLTDNSVVSFLKLRASYGITGNTPITNFPSRGLWGGGAAFAGNSGINPTQSPNPNLKWETTTQTDIGLDFGLFNGRINGEIDYYIKNTTDLLLNVNVPSTTGFLSQLRNVGELENKGWEFVLNTENLVGKFRWTTSINFARNQNLITNLDDQVIEGGFINRAVEGEAIGVFFAPEYAGVDPENGDALFFLNTQDENGNIIDNTSTTNNINEAERVVVGDPNPDFIYGINNTFSFAGFDLSIFLQGVYGNEIYNGGGVFQMDGFGWFDNQDRRVLDRWQNPGDVTDIPEVRFLNGASESSRFIDDGSYLRLKTVSIGYQLPSDFTQKLRMSKVRIYATGQNLMTFTDYQGWDPEVNADFVAGNIGLGNDFYSAPQAKTIIFGINIGF